MQCCIHTCSAVYIHAVLYTYMQCCIHTCSAVYIRTCSAVYIHAVLYTYMQSSCIHKVWLGGQTESLQNVGGGGKGVYDVLTLQKSRGARAHLGGGAKATPECTTACTCTVCAKKKPSRARSVSHLTV